MFYKFILINIFYNFDLNKYKNKLKFLRKSIKFRMFIEIDLNKDYF